MNSNSIFVDNSKEYAIPVLNIRYDPHQVHDRVLDGIVDLTRQFDYAKRIDTVTKQHITHFELTEKSLVKVLDTMLATGESFDVEPHLLDYYQTIKSWNLTDIQRQFMLTNAHRGYDQLVADIGINNLDNQLLVQDRSHRYQYWSANSISPSTLTEQIACRRQPMTWVDSDQYSFNQLIESLLELQRFPILFTLDPRDHVSNKIDLVLALTQLATALDDHCIGDIGVYARLPSASGHQFNDIVAQRQYNRELTPHTQVAVCQTVPKFLFTAGWTPKTVVFLDHNVINKKIITYAKNISDLLIAYSTKKPLQLDI